MRGDGLEKSDANMPAGLLREPSLIDCVLEIGGGEVGDLTVRRTEGRVARCERWGSRADMLRFSFAASPRRIDVDPDPERGV